MFVCNYILVGKLSSWLHLEGKLVKTRYNSKYRVYARNNETRTYPLVLGLKSSVLNYILCNMSMLIVDLLFW